MFGIPEVRFVAAEGLDIVGIDVDAQMDKALSLIHIYTQQELLSLIEETLA